MHIPVCSDYASVPKRNGGNVAWFSEKTCNHFLLCAAWSSEFSGRGLIRKQTNCLLHLVCRIILIDPSFITCQHVPSQFWTASIKLLQHELTPLNPNLWLFVYQWVGDPPCTSFSDTKMTMRYGHGHYCSNAKTSWIPRVVTLGSTLIIFSTAAMFVTVTLVAAVPHWCSSSKLHLPHLNSPNQEKDLGS